MLVFAQNLGAWFAFAWLHEAVEEREALSIICYDTALVACPSSVQCCEALRSLACKNPVLGHLP